MTLNPFLVAFIPCQRSDGEKDAVSIAGVVLNKRERSHVRPTPEILEKIWRMIELSQHLDLAKERKVGRPRK